MVAIDLFLPEWDAQEVHAVELDARAESVLEVALSTRAAPDAIVRMLFRLRGLSTSGSIEELLLGMGFEELSRSPEEVVFGAAGRPWRPGAGIDLFRTAGPGTVRIAADFRVESLSRGRTRLSTETRVAAVDAAARRHFLRYWRLIGPFSALIRRRWLAAVRRSLAA